MRRSALARRRLRATAPGAARFRQRPHRIEATARGYSRIEVRWTSGLLRLPPRETRDPRPSEPERLCSCDSSSKVESRRPKSCFRHESKAANASRPGLTPVPCAPLAMTRDGEVRAAGGHRPRRGAAPACARVAPT